MIDDKQGGFRLGRGVNQIFTLKQIGEKERRVYMGFMNLEKAYDSVNREALWQVLRIYDVGDELLSGIKSMYINSLACVRVIGEENENFRIESDVRQGCIMSPWLFNMYMDGYSDEIVCG